MSNPLRQPRRVAALRQAVGNRDGWLCHRCGQPINPTLRYPHPKSPTLEHTVNLCDDPSAAYDPARCTVSHRDCNSRAGASEGGKRRHRTPNTTARW